VEELDQENRSLRDNKYSTESRLSDITHRHELSEELSKSLQREVIRLQDELQGLHRCGPLSSRTLFALSPWRLHPRYTDSSCHPLDTHRQSTTLSFLLSLI
jgi:hypothetical protein